MQLLLEDPREVVKFWSLTPGSLFKVKVALPGHSEVDWPTKAKLKKLVWEKPLIHAAKDIGVSDVALRKHCVKLGIQLPPRGHWLRT